MPNVELHYKRKEADPKIYGPGFILYSLSHEEFKKFNPSVLGLGDLALDGKYINALTAFLDLQGFTDFCNQVDSHLVIPEFLTKYLDWLFKNIAQKFTEGDYGDHVKIWGSLPFYAKFLGDGILFIWNTDQSGELSGLKNITGKLLEVTDLYKSDFLPIIEKSVSKPPKLLRCGVARGQIISIGNGEDYVGSCINMASRLQKISLLTFAISRRGFDFEKFKGHQIDSLFELKKYSIRGIGSEELIYIRKDEFKGLPKEEKEKFLDV